MEPKVIIIGPSTFGKTTIMMHLQGKTAVPLDESDAVLTLLNNGVYPTDDKYKMDVLVPQMIDNVLTLKTIMFFSNTDYFKPEDLEKARMSGFKIIELKVDKEVMKARNKGRIDNDGYKDLSMYFSGMLSYMEDIKKKGLVDYEIDSNQPVEQVADELLQLITNHIQ